MFLWVGQVCTLNGAPLAGEGCEKFMEQSYSRWSSQPWTPMSTNSLSEMQIPGPTPDQLNEIQLHVGPEIHILILKLWNLLKSGKPQCTLWLSFCFCREVPHKSPMPSQGNQFKFGIPNQADGLFCCSAENLGIIYHFIQSLKENNLQMKYLTLTEERFKNIFN